MYVNMTRFLITVTSVLLVSLYVKAQSDSLPFPNSRFDTIEGIVVHSRTWNNDGEQRPNICFIHGFAGSTFCFRYLYDTLASLGFRIVAIDIPGAGFSDRSLDFNQSHGNRARFLWEVLHHIVPGKAGKWILVGHSMGGGTAEAMAILNQAETGKLVVIGGAVFRKSNNLGNTLMMPVRQKQVKKFMVNYADRNIITYKRFYRMLNSAYGRPPDSTEVLGYLTPLLTDGSAESLINIYVNNRERMELDVRTMTDVPVLAIWGTKDSWVPLRSVRMALEAFPDLELVKIKGAGHMPMETHPREFTPILLDFLSE